MKSDVRSSHSFPAAEVAQAVGGTQPTEWEPAKSAGYGRVNAHWRVRLADGQSAFVKQALTAEAANWLRKERNIYESVSGAFIPTLLGSYDSGTTLLALQDLSEAEWPPPWSAQRIEAVLESLSQLHATPLPNRIDSLEAARQTVTGWAAIAADPERLLATGLCSRAWLTDALPALVQASAEVELAGDDLLHFDVRSDNLCLVDNKAILVDWNLACRGNGRFDIAFWLPSLQLEGGPEPWEVLPDAGALAAAVAGFFASRAGLPPAQGAPTVREFQRAQAEAALPWAARELGLAMP